MLKWIIGFTMYAKMDDNMSNLMEKFHLFSDKCPRQPVHQLPVSDPPRRGLCVCAARRDAFAQQPPCADLSAQLRQEGAVPPGASSAVLEDVRLQ